jgi:hypothetical protein
MKLATAPIYYSLKPAIAAPTLVCAIAIGFAFVDSPWWLLSIPFAVCASMCAQPNLNLADGCLVYLAILIGIGITFFHRPSGVAICGGTLASFFLSAFEKRLRARPLYRASAIETGGNPQAHEAKQVVDGSPQ